MKKSQSALEYMMTYGWAILIIVIVAGALYSLGIFNPSASSGTVINGFSGLAVTAAVSNGNLLEISASNELGYSIWIVNVTATVSGAKYALSSCSSNALAPGMTTTCQVAGSFPSSAAANVVIYYNENGTIFNPLLQSTGTIRSSASATLTALPGLYMYVVGYSPKAGITTINPATNSIVLNSTPIIGDEQGIAITPDGKLAYVNTGFSNISIVNLTSNLQIASVDTGNTPFVIAIAKNEKLAFVSNYGSNSLTVINTTTKRDIKNISVGFSPLGVAVNPASTLVYVTNQGSSTLSVVNGTSLTDNIRNITTPGNPQSVAITPNGKLAYVACQTTPGKVSVINLTSNTDNIKNITVGPQAWTIAITPNGKLAYVSDNNGAEVTVINLTSNSDIKNISVGNNPQGIAITPDSKLVYVANYLSHTVSVISTATNTDIFNITGLGFEAGGIANGPSGTP